MFKVGDLVVNKKECQDQYRITSYRRGYIGRVTRIYDDYEIEVETVKIEEGAIGDRFIVYVKHFELYKDNRKTIDKIRESENKKRFNLSGFVPFNFTWGDR